MAYKGLDYTIVIAVVRWPKRIILVLELQVPLSSHRLALLERSLSLSLAALLSGRGRALIDSDHTVVITVIHWCLCAKLTLVTKLWALWYFFSSSLWPLYLDCHLGRGRHVACVLIGTSHMLSTSIRLAVSVSRWMQPEAAQVSTRWE